MRGSYVLGPNAPSPLGARRQLYGSLEDWKGRLADVRNMYDVRFTGYEFASPMGGGGGISPDVYVYINTAFPYWFSIGGAPKWASGIESGVAAVGFVKN